MKPKRLVVVVVVFEPWCSKHKKGNRKNTDHSILIFLNTINHNDLYTTLYNYIVTFQKKINILLDFLKLLLHRAQSLTL